VILSAAGRRGSRVPRAAAAGVSAVSAASAPTAPVDNTVEVMLRALHDMITQDCNIQMASANSYIQ